MTARIFLRVPWVLSVPFVLLLPAPGRAQVGAVREPPRLAVFHRAGQTFITWKEAEPPIRENASGKTTWGEIKALLNLPRVPNPREVTSYRIYTHTRRITPRDLAEATLLAEVGPLSAYNVNARNKEYLLGQAMAQPDEMGELARDYNGFMHTWTMDSPRMDRYPVQRFVVDERAGPLPIGTGLYVHHPKEPGKRYYAVTFCRDGVENTREITEANSLEKPVAETVGIGEPVCQGDGLWGPFFDYPGQRKVYVQWCAPPLSPRPNMCFNWSVLLPPKDEDKPRPPKGGTTNKDGLAPAELYFHPEGYSYAQPGKKMLLNSVQIAPHDYPASGWYGFNDSWGTLEPFQAGTVRNHTQKRIIAFLDWATKSLGIDPNRVLAVGADGAAALALAYPDRFSQVFITGFDRAGVLEPKAAGKFAAAWGPKDPAIQDEAGRGEWRWANLDEQVRPDAGLPLFVCRGASWGGDKGWGKGLGRFYRAMHAAKEPLVAHWAWGGNLPRPDKHTGLWRGLDLRRDAPIPAFTNCSLDREGEGDGNANANFTWKDVRETPDSLEVTVLCRECTFDLTPRRLGQFKIRPGDRVQWQATPLLARGDKKPEAQTGETAADERGLVTLKSLTIPRESSGLKVSVTRAR